MQATPRPPPHYHSIDYTELDAARSAIPPQHRPPHLTPLSPTASHQPSYGQLRLDQLGSPCFNWPHLTLDDLNSSQFVLSNLTLGVPLAQCNYFGTRNPYFVIPGASLLFDNRVLMFLPHWGYGIFGFSPIFTHFHLLTLFTHYLLIYTAFSPF